MWTEEMILRKFAGFHRSIELLPNRLMLHPWIPFSRSFPCSNPQQRRGLMVRVNYNEKQQIQKKKYNEEYVLLASKISGSTIHRSPKGPRI
jgi:hypothetical protein